MGIRSAFNPLGALPHVVVADNGYTVSWTVDNIPLVNGSYILPRSWSVGGETVAGSSLTRSNETETPANSGIYTVTLSYTVATGTAPSSVTVELNDDDFVANG